MDQVVLTRRAEQFPLVDRADVLDAQPVPSAHHGEVPQPREERLNMVRNADAKRRIHGVGHPVGNHKTVARRQALETRDARVAAPGA